MKPMIDRINAFLTRLLVADQVPLGKRRPERPCPGCGDRMTWWDDEEINNGYITVRHWYGCDQRRTAMGLHNFEEAQRHYARWTTGDKTPLTEAPL